MPMKTNKSKGIDPNLLIFGVLFTAVVIVFFWLFLLNIYPRV